MKFYFRKDAGVKPGGAGFRNYWAGSVLSVIQQFEKNYKNLKSKYSN